MAATQVIRSFLVSLAYKVETSTESKFLSSVGGATAKVLEMTAALEALALGTVAVVNKVASNFERLYYSSQRTNASIGNIKAFGYAVGQMGSSVEGGQQSLENFARTLRSSPGYLQQLQNLGIQTKNTNGSLRDMTLIMRDFGKVMSGKDYYQAKTYGEIYGIDEDTLRALMKGVGIFSDEYKQKMRAAGLDPETFGAQSVQFKNQWRSMMESIELIIDKVSANLVGKIQGPLKNFTDFLDKNSKKISDAITAIVNFILKLSEDLLKFMIDTKGVQEFLDKFSAGLEKWESYAKAVEDMAAAFFNLGKALKDMFDDPSFAALGNLDKAFHRFLGIGLFTDNGTGFDNPATSGLGETGAGAARSGAAKAHRRPGMAKDTKNYTGDNASVVRQVARDLGTSPQDLATVIGYETGGTFSPDIMGGKGGNYQGLIQFGPSERKMYGITKGMTFAQQMGKVKQFLQDRGFKPGMPIEELYSTINAGSPGHLHASDGNGTVLSHVARMKVEQAGNVQRFLNSGTAPPRALMPRPIPIVPPIKPSAITGKVEYVSPSPTGGATLGGGHTFNMGDHKTDIHMDGYFGHEPMHTAMEVGRQQSRVYEDSIRNLTNVVQ